MASIGRTPRSGSRPLGGCVRSVLGSSAVPPGGTLEPEGGKSACWKVMVSARLKGAGRGRPERLRTAEAAVSESVAGRESSMSGWRERSWQVAAGGSRRPTKVVDEAKAFRPARIGVEGEAVEAGKASAYMRRC